MEELDELIGRQIEKSIQIYASKAELLECSPLRQPRGDICIHIRLPKQQLEHLSIYGF